jgi:hypothetical protein
MTISQSKEKLKNEGYTSFELIDFDEEFYNFLLPLKCNKEKNLKDKYTQVRTNIAYKDYYNIFYSINGNFDRDNPHLTRAQHNDANEFFGITNNTSHTTHEEAHEMVNNVLDKINNTIGTLISQLWYYADINNVIEPEYTLPNSEYTICGSDSLNKFSNYIFNMVRYFFDFDEEQKYTLFAPSISYYGNGCVLGNHSDGTGTGRVCSLLIYLNEEYDENDGGILILQNTEKVIPTFGKVAIIDLQSFDIPHQVTEVTGGLGRFAILSFVKKVENELIEY